MEIIQAKTSDLIEILYLLRVCTHEMNVKGLKHWNSVFPGTERMQHDLAKGSIYLVKERGVCKGMVTLNEHEPEDYRQVSFQSGRQKPLYLQNMAVHPKWQRTGIAKMMIEYAQQLAKERGFDCIRLDVFKPSDVARQLYENQSFREVASYHPAYQQIPFICYEKQL